MWMNAEIRKVCREYVGSDFLVDPSGQSGKVRVTLVERVCTHKKRRLAEGTVFIGSVESDPPFGKHVTLIPIPDHTRVIQRATIHPRKRQLNEL
jgi:hypothetical protein